MRSLRDVSIVQFVALQIIDFHPSGAKSDKRWILHWFRCMKWLPKHIKVWLDVTLEPFCFLTCCAHAASCDRKCVITTDVQHGMAGLDCDWFPCHFEWHFLELSSLLSLSLARSLSLSFFSLFFLSRGHLKQNCISCGLSFGSLFFSSWWKGVGYVDMYLRFEKERERVNAGLISAKGCVEFYRIAEYRLHLAVAY